MTPRRRSLWGAALAAISLLHATRTHATVAPSAPIDPAPPLPLPEPPAALDLPTGVVLPFTGPVPPAGWGWYAPPVTPGVPNHSHSISAEPCHSHTVAAHGVSYAVMAPVNYIEKL